MITKARNVASGHVIDIIDTKNSSTSVCWTSVLCLIFRQIDVNVFYLFLWRMRVGRNKYCMERPWAIATVYSVCVRGFLLKCPLTTIRSRFMWHQSMLCAFTIFAVYKYIVLRYRTNYSNFRMHLIHSLRHAVNLKYWICTHALLVDTIVNTYWRINYLAYLLKLLNVSLSLIWTHTHTHTL